MNVFGLILDKEKTIERVFKICQFYNVKNVDLAELMYTTEVEISNWKTGKRFPDWDKILLFAYVSSAYNNPFRAAFSSGTDSRSL